MPEDAWTLDSGHLAAYWKCNHREREDWPGRGENGERRSDDMAEAERREEDGPRDYKREMTVDRAVENAALLGAQSKKETKRKRLSKASGVFSFHDILGILNRDHLKDWFKSPTS